VDLVLLQGGKQNKILIRKTFLKMINNT
jgi:hypothetical protein